jgi:hypothetical protein
VVTDLLLRASIDAPPGKIKSWNYFADAIAEAERFLNGLTRADLRASWRSKPLDAPF